MLNSFFKTVGKFAVGGVSAAAVAALGPLDSYVTHKLEKFTAKVAVEIAAFMPSTEDIVQAILDAQAAEPTKGSVWSFYATLAEGCLAFVGNFLHAVVQHPLLVLGVSGAVYLCRSTLLPFFASLKASTAFLWKPFTSFAAWCATFFNPSSGASDAPMIQNAQRITTDTTVTLQQVTNIVTEHIKKSEDKQGASLKKLKEMHEKHFADATEVLDTQVRSVAALVDKVGKEHKQMCDRANKCMDSAPRYVQEFAKTGKSIDDHLGKIHQMQAEENNLHKTTLTKVHNLHAIFTGPIFRRLPADLKEEITEAYPDVAKSYPEFFKTTEPGSSKATEAAVDTMAELGLDVASTSQATTELPFPLFVPEPVIKGSKKFWNLWQKEFSGRLAALREQATTQAEQDAFDYTQHQHYNALKRAEMTCDEYEACYHQYAERAAQNLLPDLPYNPEFDSDSPGDSGGEAHSMLEALDPTFLLDNPSPLWVVSGCVVTVCIVYFTFSLLKRRKGAPKRK